MSLKSIPLAELQESPVALRTVDTASAKFLEIVASVREVGILNPILVRKRPAEDGSVVYEVIEGLHRTTAARQAGLTEIPAQVVDFDDDKVLEAQTIGNLMKVDTKPTEYTEQLKRYLARNPMMTIAELAKKLGASAVWIEQRLMLSKIVNPHIKELIDAGKIGLANAYAMGKLPENEQTDFVEAAMTEPMAQFAERVAGRCKEIRDTKRQGGLAAPTVFTPVAHLRKLKEIEAEIASGSDVGKKLTEGLKKGYEGFILGLKYVIHMDDESIAMQRATFEAAEKERHEKAELRKAEILKRKTERAQLAAKVAANAQAEMEGKPLPHPEVVATASEEEKNDGADAKA